MTKTVDLIITTMLISITILLNRGLITINSDGTWSKNVDYFTLGHVSKFVNPGAHRIDSTSLDDNIETVAFKNTDGSKVLVMANLIDKEQEVKIKWGNQYTIYTMPAESLVTMTWSGEQSGSSPAPIWFNNLESNSEFSSDGDSTVVLSQSTASLGGSNGRNLPRPQTVTLA